MKQKVVSIFLVLIIIILPIISFANNETNNTSVNKSVNTSTNTSIDTSIEKKKIETEPKKEENKIENKTQQDKTQNKTVENKTVENKTVENKTTEKNTTNTTNTTTNTVTTEKTETETITTPLTTQVTANVIPEGIYEIYSATGETKAIDIHGANKSNNGNVEIYERNNQNNQKFKVQLNSDGTYTFFALHSNKVLDVYADRKVNETNVSQYDYHNADNQKWYIKPTNDGYYYIVSKSSGLYLDVYQGHGKDGQNVQIYKGNNGRSQKFKFSKVISTGSKTIENGIYNIYLQVANDRLLEVPNNSTKDEEQIKTGNNKNLASQKFQVTYNNDGTYYITVLHTGKALDVRAGDGRNKTVIQQYAKHGGDTQKWFIQKNSNGTYSLISKCTGLALDINQGSKSIGAKIQTFNFHGEESQQFTFKECSKTTTGTQSIEDGTYRMLSSANNKKVIQVTGGSTANGATMQMWDNNQTTQQKYDITYTGDGYYKIKSKKSGKVLTVESVTPTVGSSIKQDDDKNLDTQKWVLKKYDEATYAIISKCSNLYITLLNSNIQNGQTLKLLGETDLSSQRFILVNETPKNNIKIIEDGIYQIITKGNKVLDISGATCNNVANSIIWDNNKSQNQKVKITRIGNTNYYQMLLVHSLKSLDVEGNNTNPGANVIQYTYTGADNQQWLIKDCGNGYYNIISKQSGLYLDVTGASVSKSGTNVELWYGNGGDAQKFKLLSVNMINNDSYRITSQANSSKYLDVAGNTQLDNANVQIAAKTGDNNQIFRVESTDNMYYKIIARHSNKVLTVLSNNNVVQATDTDADTQKWILEMAGDNTYKIKSKSTNLYLNVTGTNIQVEKANGTKNQNFRFNNLEQKKGIDVSEYNGLINWQQVKMAGIDYAIIRVGYRGYRTGAFAEDKNFKINIMGAKRAGLKVGVYFFSQAVNEAEARQEATWTLSKIRESGYENQIDYPVIIDTESSGGNPPGRADGLDAKARTSVCKAFCDTIKSNGYRPMIYASKNWFYNNLDMTQLNQYNIWLAHYTGSASSLSDYKYHYEIWQYTKSGQVKGINGEVDMNICYQSY